MKTPSEKTIQIPADLHQKLKVYCAQTGSSIVETITALIRELVSRGKKK